MSRRTGVSSNNYEVFSGEEHIPSFDRINARQLAQQSHHDVNLHLVHQSMTRTPPVNPKSQLALINPDMPVAKRKISRTKEEIAKEKDERLQGTTKKTGCQQKTKSSASKGMRLDSDSDHGNESWDDDFDKKGKGKGTLGVKSKTKTASDIDSEGFSKFDMQLAQLWSATIANLDKKVQELRETHQRSRRPRRQQEEEKTTQEIIDETRRERTRHQDEARGKEPAVNAGLPAVADKKKRRQNVKLGKPRAAGTVSQS